MSHIPNEEANPFLSLADLALKGESIAAIATAVEQNEIYYWDRFGRFRKATNAEDKKIALDQLANLYEWELKHAPPFNINPLEIDFCNPLYGYGWAKNLLPNFEEIHKNLENIKSPISKSAETNHRNTLLKLIDALCKKSNIDIRQRGAAKKLANITEENNLPVSDDTISKVFDRIIDEFNK